MKTIILSVTPYKDKNAIFNAVNEKEVYSFLGRGILSAKARNAALNNPLTICEVELLEDPKYKINILKTSKILASPMNLIGNIKSLSLIMLLEEIVKSCLLEEENVDIFPTLLKGLENIYQNKKVYESFINIVFEILKIGGFGFSTRCCINCGRTSDYVGFSILDGGLICKYCDFDALLNLSKEGVKTLCDVINDKTLNFENIILDEKDFTEIVSQLMIFIEDNYNIKVKNKELVL